MLLPFSSWSENQEVRDECRVLSQIGEMMMMMMIHTVISFSLCLFYLNCCLFSDDMQTEAAGMDDGSCFKFDQRPCCIHIRGKKL